LLTLTGCTMGQACEQTSDCGGSGVCLKGVCSGYSCQDQQDCTGDYTCGRVLDAQACVLSCTEDDDCGGGQTCREIPMTTDDDSQTDRICL
jgi:hypothetical protein